MNYPCNIEHSENIFHPFRYLIFSKYTLNVQLKPPHKPSKSCDNVVSQPNDMETTLSQHWVPAG